MASSDKHPSNESASTPVESFDDQYSHAHPVNIKSPVSLASVSNSGTPAPPDSDEDLDCQGQPIDITKFHGPKSKEEVDKLKHYRVENQGDLVRACATMIDCLGEDLEREGLQKTPQRMAKALSYFTSGYETSLEGKLQWRERRFFRFLDVCCDRFLIFALGCSYLTVFLLRCLICA